MLLHGTSPEIITRHDKSDKDFQDLGKDFQKYMCHLNLPDCEGTMIEDKWAISAAHCSIEIQNKLKAGETHQVIVNGEKIEVDEVIIHKKWKRDEAFDLALIHLKNAPKYGTKVELFREKNELGKIVYVIGRGDKGNGQVGIDGNDGKLRGATNRVEEATDYWLKWVFDDPDGQSKNLTDYEGISGPGDSGGPAFIKEGDQVYVAGISSGQSTKGSGGVEGKYGVKEYYVRISQYIDWIEGEICKSDKKRK